MACLHMSHPSPCTLLWCTSLVFLATAAAEKSEPESCSESSQSSTNRCDTNESRTRGDLAIDALMERAQSSFSEVFQPQDPDVPIRPIAVTFAPGRVNLIGEHTDYNDGYVLPIALELGTVAVGRVSRDGLSRFYSVDKGGAPSVFAVTDAPTPTKGGWTRYVHGVLAQYLDVVDEAVHSKAGWGIEAVVASTVPLGSGLSSSASLEVAVATLVEELFHVGSPTVPPASKARRCQLAEHVYAGVPCGMMDQLASVAGVADHAVLIDTKVVAAAPTELAADTNPSAIQGVSLVPLADPDMRIVVIDSLERHALSDGEEPWYPLRVAQCATAVEAIVNATATATVHVQHHKQASKGESSMSIRTLRDCTLDMLEHARPARVATATIKPTGRAESSKMEEPIWYRRARHVISENQRVLDGANALRNRDWELFGQMMLASHGSLRDDYDVTTEKLDWLSAEASNVEGIYGARMTGAGLGGCVVALARDKEAVDALRIRIREGYEAKFGVVPSIFVTRAGHGARVLMAASDASK